MQESRILRKKWRRPRNDYPINKYSKAQEPELKAEDRKGGRGGRVITNMFGQKPS